mmetsp:Transcript_40724/g.68179  ORF Transcript_40724/g.68179 Transcript_40724/m.68179 type:complete len:402 (-) Transcript_40724:168-1373(-)
MSERHYTIVVGTYTAPLGHAPNAHGKGLLVMRMDRVTGELEHVATNSTVEHPSFLCYSPRFGSIYAISEVSVDATVHSFGLEADSGQLVHWNSALTHGATAAHVVLSADSRWLFVCNYAACEPNTVAVLPLSAEGRILKAVCVVTHSGSNPAGRSLHPDRQASPHPHQVVLSPRDQKFAYVPDLGLDKIFAYQFDSATGNLTPHPTQPYLELPPGSGPRHLVFQPATAGGAGDGDILLAWVANELSNDVTALAHNPQSGHMQVIQTVPTVPVTAGGAAPERGSGHGNDITTADIHVHPSGRFLYTSIRGHDSLAVYAIDQATGRLTHLQQVPTGGHEGVKSGEQTPRNFAITPCGEFLLVANQTSDSVVVFKVDQEAGRLVLPAKHVCNTIASPVCIEFAC